jgi:hypothetical protein
MVDLLLECTRSEIVLCETQIVGSRTKIENYCALRILYVLHTYVYDMIEEHSSLHRNMNNKEHSPVRAFGLWASKDCFELR